MNRIRRFFNQNRELIVRIIIIVVACFVALKLINYVAKIKKEQNSNQANTTLTTNNRSYDRDYAIASGERKNENTYYKENNVINTFFDFCNDKNFEEAYKLLSDECKSVLYPDVETFTKQYGEKLFNEKKDCIIQAWYSNIYRIKITADLLASGSTGETDYIEEYCCVIGEKLNINNFIGMNKMNKIVEKANVTIPYIWII